MNPLDWLAALGRAVLGVCRTAGSVTLFAVEGVSHVVRPPLYGRMFGRAFVEFSYFSLPVVALTAIFSGMVIGAAILYRLLPVQRGGVRSPRSSCCPWCGSLGRCWRA